MEILSIAILTFIASIIGTITWFWTSTIMIPVLLLFFPPIEAILLVSIIHWFWNIWKIWFFHKGFNLQLLLLFGLTGLVTSYIGAALTKDILSAFFLHILGVFLVIYSLFLIFSSHFKIPANIPMAILGGSLSWFFAGAFGIGGTIRSMFLSAFDLPKAMFIATAWAIWILVDSIRILTYFINGTTLPTNLWWSLLIFILVSFIGAQIAKKIIDKIPQKKFRTVVAFFLLLIGIKLLISWI